MEVSCINATVPKMSVALVRVRQRNRTNRGDIRLLQELAYVFIWAEKSHYVPSASWRTKRAGGIIYPESESLRTKRVDSVNPIQGEVEMRRASSSRQEAGNKRGEFLLPPLFVLFRPSVGWAMPTHVGEGHLLY